jgi:hypothetical protein
MPLDYGEHLNRGHIMRAGALRLMLISLAIVIGVACSGGDDDDSATPTATRAAAVSATPATSTPTATPTPTPTPVDPATLVRLNELQVIGTHNSYHLRPAPAVLAAIAQLRPDFAQAIEFSHRPLEEQLSLLGVRQLELDVFYDPEGGLYANRVGPGLLGQDPASGLPELDEPGFKVMHSQDIDFETTCLTLVICLEEIEAWSDAHPAHLPVLILIEAKDEPLEDPIGAGFTIPLPIDAAALNALDEEIRSVIGEDDMLTPDELIGMHETLEAAILADGWPTLAELRGQLLFALDSRDQRELYLAEHPSLVGRVMFTAALPGEDDAAFVKLNDAFGDADEIRAAVEAGYLVRTRADIDTIEAREGDTTRLEAALASGAQFVSSDYPESDEAFGTGYVATLPDGGLVRCNPVSADADCDPAAFEE